MYCRRCPQVAARGRQLCESCIAQPAPYGSARQIAWQKKQAGLGNCVVCGEDAYPYRRCDKHRAMERERAAKRAAG